MPRRKKAEERPIIIDGRAYLRESTFIGQPVAGLENRKYFKESLGASLRELDSTILRPAVIHPLIHCIRADTMTRNFTFYMSESLMGDVELMTGYTSWMLPYPTPWIKDHDTGGMFGSTSEIYGRTVDAFWSTNAYQDKGAISAIPAIVDPYAIERILDGRWQTVSIGVMADEVYCSICGQNLADEDTTCAHYKGRKYKLDEEDEEPQICFYKVGPITCRETSFVTVPSDVGARVAKTDTTPEDYKVLASNPKQEFVFDMSDKHRTNLLESEDPNEALLAERLISGSAWVLNEYLNTKRTFVFKAPTKSTSTKGGKDVNIIYLLVEDMHLDTLQKMMDDTKCPVCSTGSWSFDMASVDMEDEKMHIKCTNCDTEFDLMWGTKVTKKGKDPNKEERMSELEEKKLTPQARKSLPDSAFALVYTDKNTGKKVRRFPIMDRAHSQNALARLPQAKGLTPAQRATVKRKAQAALKKFGGKPSEMPEDIKKLLEDAGDAGDKDLEAPLEIEITSENYELLLSVIEDLEDEIDELLDTQSDLEELIAGAEVEKKNLKDKVKDLEKSVADLQKSLDDMKSKDAPEKKEKETPEESEDKEEKTDDKDKEDIEDKGTEKKDEPKEDSLEELKAKVEAQEEKIKELEKYIEKSTKDLIDEKTKNKELLIDQIVHLKKQLNRPEVKDKSDEDIKNDLKERSEESLLDALKDLQAGLEDPTITDAKDIEKVEDPTLHTGGEGEDEDKDKDKDSPSPPFKELLRKALKGVQDDREAAKKLIAIISKS